MHIMKQSAHDPIVVCDLDGVLLNILKPILIDIELKYGHLVACSDITDYNIGKSVCRQLSLEGKEAELICATISDSIATGKAMEYGNFYRDMVISVVRLFEKLPFIFATAREHAVLPKYKDHVVTNTIADIVCLFGKHLSRLNKGQPQTKFVKSKTDVFPTIEKDRTICLVEDSISEVKQALLWRRNHNVDVRVVLVDRPWNRNEERTLRNNHELTALWYEAGAICYDNLYNSVLELLDYS